jgi:hypothetical protein
MVTSASSHSAQCQKIDRLSYFKEKGVILGRQLSIEQLERGHMIPVKKDGETTVLPFGYANNDWIELKGKWRKGDHFLEMKSSDKLARRKKFYMDGHALIRGNCIVGFIKGAVS